MEEKKTSKGLKEDIEIPEGVQVSVENEIVRVKGLKGELERRLKNPRVEIAVKNSNVVLTSKKNSKKEKKILGTFLAHISNMIEGVQNEYVYKLKICSGHFPMSVSVKDNKFIVQNFYGEKIPRVLNLRAGAKVEVKGDLIEVSSIDKEAAGQTAASIEQLTRRPHYDHRIFQDGIYMIEKAGKEIK
ncbi:50S ribosomal protein L6 [Candidatus Woesearchaeota archaeon]|nr:50S ribosomal protein L6 [Candidatus Woesearchaeota archaeon]